MKYNQVEQNITYRKYSEICGLIPIVIGSVIFFAWLIFRDVRFVQFGMLTIAGGVILFLIGSIFLLLYYLKENPGYKKLFRPAFILLINFPVAAFYIYFASSILFSHLVNTTNNCPQDTRIELTDPSGKIYQIRIDASKHTSKRFHFLGEGSVKYRLYIAEKFKQKGTFVGYTSSGIGGEVDASINETCNLLIKEKFHKN